MLDLLSKISFSGPVPKYTPPLKSERKIIGGQKRQEFVIFRALKLEIQMIFLYLKITSLAHHYTDHILRKQDEARYSHPHLELLFR